MFGAKVDPRQYADVEDMASMMGHYATATSPATISPISTSYAATPLRTQDRPRQILDSQYQPTPDGLVRNDNLGQMSAWLILNILGFSQSLPHRTNM